MDFCIDSGVHFSPRRSKLDKPTGHFYFAATPGQVQAPDYRGPAARPGLGVELILLSLTGDKAARGTVQTAARLEAFGLGAGMPQRVK